MCHGFMCLVAGSNWYSRRVLSWRLSNTLEAGFCVAVLKDAIGRYGKPENFNADLDSQSTSLEFTGVLKDDDIAISMDGKGRWMDNALIEGLWWSLEYECVYLNDFQDGKALSRGIRDWMDFYNLDRGHSSLDDKTPDQAYAIAEPTMPGHAQAWSSSKIEA